MNVIYQKTCFKKQNQIFQLLINRHQFLCQIFAIFKLLTNFMAIKTCWSSTLGPWRSAVLILFIICSLGGILINITTNKWVIYALAQPHLPKQQLATSMLHFAHSGTEPHALTALELLQQLKLLLAWALLATHHL